MNPDANNTIMPFIDHSGRKDSKRPVISFFNPAPRTVMTLRGVNGDLDRRYVDIGTKHLDLIDSQFDELILTPGVLVS